MNAKKAKALRKLCKYKPSKDETMHKAYKAPNMRTQLREQLIVDPTTSRGAYRDLKKKIKSGEFELV